MGEERNTRVDIDALVKKIDAADPESVEEFREIIECVVSGAYMTPGEFSDELMCSPATVERWSQGLSAPGPSTRREILRYLRHRLGARLSRGSPTRRFFGG